MMGELLLIAIAGLFLTPIYPAKLLVDPTSGESEHVVSYSVGAFLEFSQPPLEGMSTKHKNTAFGLALESSLTKRFGLRGSVSGLVGDDMDAPNYKINLGLPMTLVGARKPWKIWKIAADYASVFFRPDFGLLNYSLKSTDDRITQYSYGAFLGTGYSAKHLWFQLAYGYRAHTKVKQYEPRNGSVIEANVGVTF